MNKAIAVLITLTVLFVAGCVQDQSVSSEVKTQPSGTSAQGKQELSSCHEQLALIEKAVTFDDVREIYNCFAQVAISKQDASICDIYDQEKLLSNVKPICVYFATKSRHTDKSYCKEIQDYTTKSICYNKLAVLKSDVSLCDELPEQYMIDNCYKVGTYLTVDGVEKCETNNPVDRVDYCMRTSASVNKYKK